MMRSALQFRTAASSSFQRDTVSCPASSRRSGDAARELQISGKCANSCRRAAAPQAVRPLLRKLDENYDFRTTFKKARRKFTISVPLFKKLSGNSKSQPEF